MTNLKSGQERAFGKRFSSVQRRLVGRRRSLPERAPRNGVSEGAPKNGVSERAPFVAVEGVIFHQLPTSVTRNGRATFVSVIPSYSVECGSRPCLTRTAP